MSNTESLWGYINEKGEEIIECQYMDAKQFGSNGLAAVSNTEWIWGLINEKGEEVTPFIYSNIFIEETDGEEE